MVALRLGALCAALVAAGCYSPSISECKISCGQAGSCPSDTTCMSDGFCHADIAVVCKPITTADASVVPDAKTPPIDAPRLPDAKPGEPDARVPDARPGEPDARVPDAGTPDANPLPCTNEVSFIEHNDVEDSIISNLSVEPNGQVHVTYYDQNSLAIRYAHRVAGGDWHFEDVGPAQDNLRGQTVDATGAVHIIFNDRDLLSARVRYGRRSVQGVWSLETIDDGDIGVDGTIVVDKSQRVHVAWWRNLSSLVYATRGNNQDGWQLDTVDNNGVVGEHPSIGLSATGVISLSYRIAGTKNDLGLASRKTLGGNWNLARPDQQGNVGSYTALAVDTVGNVHIAYADSTNEQLKYAFLPVAGGPTQIVTVEPSVGVGRFNAIALDGRGGVHLSYYAYAEQNLRYAVKTAGSVGFTARTLDSAGNVGRHSSIGTDGASGVHISYIDDSNGDVKYVHICP